MKARLVILLAALALPSLLGAKGPNTRIEVALDGARLATITDENVLDKLTFWSGPGTWMQAAGGPARMSTGDADIADWLAGKVPPPVKTRVYDVSIYFSTPRNPSNPRERGYTVRYAPSAGGGFIQIPGEGSPYYRGNTSVISRGVEGSWYRASKRWEDLIRPVIERARVEAK